MQIHALTNNERPMYSLDTGAALTNFNDHRYNERLNNIELYNNGLYMGLIKSASVRAFQRAFKKAKAA